MRWANLGKERNFSLKIGGVPEIGALPFCSYVGQHARQVYHLVFVDIYDLISTFLMLNINQLIKVDSFPNSLKVNLGLQFENTLKFPVLFQKCQHNLLSPIQ